LGTEDRSEAFAADTSLPSGFYRVTKNDYKNTGYDRGHNCPSADRTRTTTDNVATFLMTNMSPQSPTVNRLGRAWESLETYTRGLVKVGNEVYVICGGQGEAGEIAHGKVKVPAYIWKVIVVLPDKSGSDLNRITTSTRVIAVMIPNEKGNVDKNWRHHRTTIAEIEAVTGLNLLSRVPAAAREALKSKVDEG
jgi:endonuclease G